MYRVTIDGKPLFRTDDMSKATTLINPKLDLEVGKAGTFTFGLPPDNLEYSNIKPLVSIIRVYQNNNLIFTGRTLDYEEDFYGIKQVTVEGILAIFNDSVIGPFIYTGTIKGYIESIVVKHNAQLGAGKTVQVGEITVTDPNDYIRRELKTYKNSMELLNGAAETLGGYFILKEAPNPADPYILDFVKDFPANTVTSINFGDNLLDVEKEIIATELMTGILPLGAELETDGTTPDRERLTIKTVNNGEEVLWADEATIKKHGKIVGIREYKDITRAENLKAKAQKDLDALTKGYTSIKIKAVDLQALTGSIDFVVGRNVVVNSKRHGLENIKMLIEKQTIELLNPENSTFEVGTKKLGFIESSINKGNEYKEIIKVIESNYATNKDLVDTNLNIGAVKEELKSSINQTAEDIKLHVGETYVTDKDFKEKYTQMDITVEGVKTSIKDINGVLTVLNVTKDGLVIGKSDSPIKSVQDNQSYKFVDETGTTLLELNSKGVNTPAVNITKQLKIGDMWAIRHGEYIRGKGYNLDDVWLG